MKKYYFLFGQDACAAYSQREDFEEFKEAYDQEDFNCTLFVYEDGVTSPVDLLSEFYGKDDYICLTKEEYEELKEII